MSTLTRIAIGSLVGLCCLFGTTDLLHAQDSTKSGAEKKKQRADDGNKKTTKGKKKAETDQSGSAELPFEAKGPVAVVDDETVSAEAYNKEVQKVTERMNGFRGSFGYRLADRMRWTLLDKMIERHLVDRELKKSGVQASNKDVDERSAEIKQRIESRIGDDKDFDWYLEKRGLDKEEFRKQVEKQVQIEKALKKRGKNLSVSDKEAKKYYEQHKKRYSHPKRVRARHILIRFESGQSASEKEKKQSEKKAKKKAQKLAKKARSGDVPFAKLAREHSEGPSASKGGDLGYFPKDRMTDAFANKAFSMEPGTISDPVKSEFGYHVIYVMDVKPAHTEPFAEVKDDIISQQKRKKTRDAVREFIDELKSNADIEKKKDNIVINLEKPEGGSGSRMQQLKKKLKMRKQEAESREKSSPDPSDSQQKPDNKDKKGK